MIPTTAINLRDAAHGYASRGLRVLPLFGPKVFGCCVCLQPDCPGPGRHPRVEVRAATTDAGQIDTWWDEWSGASVGITTGGESWIVVLEVSKPEGQRAVEDLGPLPRTWKAVAGGSEYFYFRHPGSPIHGIMPPIPGVTLRADGDFVCAPPSMVTPEVECTWEIPLDAAPLAELSPNLLARLAGPPAQMPASGAAPPDGGGREASVAEDMVAAHEGAEASEAPEPESRVILPGDGIGPGVSPLIQVPDFALVGVGREVADLYASYLESPRAFFYFVFAAYFGAAVCGKITLASELRPQPRLYVVLLGESADTRKSTALQKIDDFFRALPPALRPSVLFGVGSAEGLAAALKGAPSGRLTLHYDELKGFVDKAKNEYSVLLPMVTTLFERNDYDNRTKSRHVSVRGASLTVVAACTQDTYATMFAKEFHAIGFLNRLWLVLGRSTKRIPVPQMIPAEERRALKEKVAERLRAIDTAYRQNKNRPVAYPMTPEAAARFQEWYAQRVGSIFERRLDTYGHRLMLIQAAMLGRTVIDLEIVEGVIALLDYQLDVRRECDPVDAENSIATMEEKIRRVLAKKPLREREVKRRCHYERAGLWVWNKALENLKKAGEVAYCVKTSLLSLVNPPDVPGGVPRQKTPGC